MKHYDYIFAGAGCAGLSMVYHLLNSPLRNSKILLLDPNMGQIPDKTWCYWAEKPLPIHPRNAIHSWNQLSLSSNYEKATHQMENLQYFHINSRDF
ncbi:MAG TPA: Lycopene beta cyclase, partial [Algoriphagus sp.]|nr:Lycopene beta cyclase [Algoriphagus sp.]